MQFGIEYRPYNFSGVIAQDKVVKGLQNSLSKGNLGHAVALIGNSGLGKSTLARIVAMTLNCEHPIKTDKGIEPCCECASCKDVMLGRFNRSIQCINGNDLTIDKMRDLQESLNYDSMTDPNTVIILEEAQTVPTQSFKSFLVLLEKEYEHVYFILTSTDEGKFSSSYASAKDNATREKNALRSRLSLYKLENPTTDSISNYIFELFTTKIDPNGELPDECMNIIPYIAQNSKNNIRQALNDFNVILDAECYNKEEVIKLLGYEDEEKESEMVISLLYKDKTALKYISESTDVEGNFNYWYSIISRNAMRDMMGIAFESSWKEKSYAKMKASGNLLALYDVFNKTQQLTGSYFNPNVFISMLYEYYCGNNHNSKRLVENASSNSPTNSSNTTETTVVKKVKKVVKE